MRHHEVAPRGHLPAVSLVRARENGEKRGLAAAVRAEHADTGTIRDREIDPVENPATTERLDDAASGEEWNRAWLGHRGLLVVSVLRLGGSGCTFGVGFSFL
jgi:hypothetical protein